uniref:Uncharacterized protein n=1 Tax=Myotis myotis TaxID=51298 RepID=A0A7J7U5C7_MYOMY|nr:hypothetical protein mMyoMyo1_008854 [Myotis myotis]
MQSHFPQEKSYAHKLLHSPTSSPVTPPWTLSLVLSCPQRLHPQGGLSPQSEGASAVKPGHTLRDYPPGHRCPPGSSRASAQREEETWMRKKHQLAASCTPPPTGHQPETWACALDQNGTGKLLVHRTDAQPTEPHQPGHQDL